jgi:hypothetical protein
LKSHFLMLMRRRRSVASAQRRAEKLDSLELVSGMRVRNQGGGQVRVVLATLRQVHARRLCGEKE